MTLGIDSAKVLSGQVMQRVFSFVFIPVITRLVGPADYGIVQAALSVFVFTAVVGTLGFQAAIPVAASTEAARRQTIATIMVGLFSALIFWAGLHAGRPIVERLFTAETAFILLRFSPVFIALQIANNCLRTFLGYLGKFNVYPLADSLGPVVNFLALLAAYLLVWKDYRCLVAGALAVLAVNFIIYLRASWPALRLRSGEALRFASLPQTLWQARRFSKFNFPSDVLNSASANLPITLMAVAFPQRVAGLFAMAFNIMAIPTQISGGALGQVYYPRAAQAQREGKGLRDITWQTFLYSCRLAIYPALLIAASSWFVLPALFGPSWYGVAGYVNLLLPMVLVNAVQTQIGIGFVFSILEQQHKILLGNLLLFGCRFLPLLASVMLLTSSHWATLNYALGGAVGYALLISWVFSSVSIHLLDAAWVWLKHILIAAGCTAPVFLSVWLHRPLWLGLWLIVSAACYGWVGWRFFLNPGQRSVLVSLFYRRIPFLRKA